MAHSNNSTQLQLIAVLAFLGLLTHNNVFWVGALLLAVVRLPDFITPLNSIDRSLQTLAERSEEKTEISAVPEPEPETVEVPSPENQQKED